MTQKTKSLERNAQPSVRQRRKLQSASAMAETTKARASTAMTITPCERHEMIARAAYFRAERRGFEPNDELRDWLEAEQEVNVAYGLAQPEPRWDLRVPYERRNSCDEEKDPSVGNRA